MEKLYKPETYEELKELCDNPSIHLGTIDTSLITDMGYLFANSTRTNAEFEGIETWDTSNVEEMSNMFEGATYFNQPIGNWDVSKVIYMFCMFEDATSFNQDISSWDVRNVLHMGSMFYNATSFNQTLEEWNFANIQSASAFSSKELPFFTEKLNASLKKKGLHHRYAVVFLEEGYSYVLRDTLYNDEYHIIWLDILRKEFDKTIQEAVKALRTREADNKRKAKLMEFLKKNASRVEVELKDSYSAGNCVQGTQEFCEKHKIDTNKVKSVNGAVIFKLGKEDPLAINALIKAFERSGIDLPC